MNVVAEGVETEAARKKLLELGCDFGQGWHFGRPAALQDLAIQYAKT
jgi:EAL domain-containing protein (putative c-di-GMP-specific phosphodiesterase class I)